MRILRACKELDIRTVAVHSTADGEAMHVRLADESVCIGPESSLKSYLNIPAVLSAAEVTGAEAIHPGFGFLSENAKFASMVREHGLAFVGPSSEHIAMMGHKGMAKQKAQELGLVVIQGSCAEIRNLQDGLFVAQSIGYPLLLKATAGGGGKGMRVVWQEKDLQESMMQAQAEALNSFGCDGIYMEKYLQHPRHVEFQVLGDLHGNMVCLGDRDCSLQRNHQKIWEEAPCIALSPSERQNMMEKVSKAMSLLGYYSAGTLEFLYEDGVFYFIEMNTRIQVEHPVTEMVVGVDIVKEQIRIAAGLPLSFTQQEVRFHGHAIECRINAEHPETFLPSPGRVDAYLAPGGPFTRMDSALFPGYVIPPFYDSLIGKLIVYGQDRLECLARLQRALNECVIGGVHTLLPLHKRLCSSPAVIRGDFDVTWLEREFLGKEERDCAL